MCNSWANWDEIWHEPMEWVEDGYKIIKYGIEGGGVGKKRERGRGGGGGGGGEEKYGKKSYQEIELSNKKKKI